MAYLIDPMLLGQLYLGNLRFEADPFTDFKKNLTTLRIECKALYHVRQPEGAQSRGSIVMAKVTLKVAHNVSLARGGSIQRAGDTFETERDNEVEQWFKHGYALEVKTRRRSTKKK